MGDDLDDLTENLTQRSTWLRVFFMAGFCLALYVVGVVLFFITVAQALFSVITGSDNGNLRVLGANLAEYVNQILRYLTYNSQARPFPFSPFPDVEELTSQSAEPQESGLAQRPGGAEPEEDPVPADSQADAASQKSAAEG